MNLKKLGIELALIGLFCVMSIGFIITYIMAVYNEHVSPYFPYISDTGSEPPESCVFSLVCSVGAILTLIIIYVRHKFIHEHYKDNPAKVTCLNLLATALGGVTILGMLLVGSFQDNKVAVVHYIGAEMVFGFGLLYQWVHFWISIRIFKTRSNSAGRGVLIFRLVLCIIGSISFLGTTILTPISRKYFHNLYKNFLCAHCWETQDGGYALHVISTGMEWIMVLAFLLYFLSFHSDFTKIRVEISVKTRYHHTDNMTDGAAINEKTRLY